MAVACGRQICYTVNEVAGRSFNDLSAKEIELINNVEKHFDCSTYSDWNEFLTIFLSANSDDDPFLIVDLSAVISNVLRWRRALPKLQLFYTVKPNTPPALFPLLHGMGCGFDCPGDKEVQLCVSRGVSPDRVLASQPVRTPALVTRAATSGVGWAIVDRESEMAKLRTEWPHAKILILLRASADLEDVPKFGASMDTAIELLQYAQDHNLHVVGVSCPFGHKSSWPGDVNNAKLLFKRAEELGMHLDILDVGDVSGSACDGVVDLGDVQQRIECVIDSFPTSTVIARSNAFLASQAFCLVTCIISERKNVKGEREYIVHECASSIKTGRYSLCCPLLYQTSTESTVGCCEKDGLTEAIIATPCRNNALGIILRQRMPHLEVGDWLAFPDIGDGHDLRLATKYVSFRDFGDLERRRRHK